MVNNSISNILTNMITANNMSDQSILTLNKYKPEDEFVLLPVSNELLDKLNITPKIQFNDFTSFYSKHIQDSSKRIKVPLKREYREFNKFIYFSLDLIFIVHFLKINNEIYLFISHVDKICAEWKGDKLGVYNRYSLAGLSTSNSVLPNEKIELAFFEDFIDDKNKISVLCYENIIIEKFKNNLAPNLNSVYFSYKIKDRNTELLQSAFSNDYKDVYILFNKLKGYKETNDILNLI